MVAQVFYRSFPMGDVDKGSPMGHSAFRPLQKSRDHHSSSKLLDKTNINVLHTVGVNPSCNQFGQYPLCNVDQLWQHNELHQMPFGVDED